MTPPGRASIAGTGQTALRRIALVHHRTIITSMRGWNATRANLAVNIMAVAISLALLAFPFGNGYAPVAAAQAHAPAVASSQHDHHAAAGHAEMTSSELAADRTSDCDHPVSKPASASCDEGSCAYGLCHAMVAVPEISFDRLPLQDSHMSGPAIVIVMLAGEMADRPPRT